MSEQAELPRYKCNKEVRALKIEEIVLNHNSSLDFFFGEDFQPINVESENLENKPVPEVGMYYVVYKGGYFSFSPADTFEEGYERIV